MKIPRVPKRWTFQSYFFEWKKQKQKQTFASIQILLLNADSSPSTSFPSQVQLHYWETADLQRQTVRCIFFFCRTALDLLPQKKLLPLYDSKCKPEGALFLKSCGQGEHRQLQPQSRMHIWKDQLRDFTSSHTSAFYDYIVLPVFCLLWLFSLGLQLKMIL